MENRSCILHTQAYDVCFDLDAKAKQYKGLANMVVTLRLNDLYSSSQLAASVPVCTYFGQLNASIPTCIYSKDLKCLAQYFDECCKAVLDSPNGEVARGRFVTHDLDFDVEVDCGGAPGETCEGWLDVAFRVNLRHSPKGVRVYVGATARMTFSQVRSFTEDMTRFAEFFKTDPETRG